MWIYDPMGGGRGVEVQGTILGIPRFQFFNHKYLYSTQPEKQLSFYVDTQS